MRDKAYTAPDLVKKLSEDKAREIVVLRLKGETVENIADKLNASRSTVYKYLALSRGFRAHQMPHYMSFNWKSDHQGGKMHRLRGMYTQRKIELYGLRLDRDVEFSVGLPKIIVEEARRQGFNIMDSDVVVVTSKVVSKAEGRLYKLSDVKPSWKARMLSRVYGKDAREVELITRNSDGIDFIIPVYKLAKKYGKLFKEYVADGEAALNVIRKDPYIFMANVHDLILTDAGLDFSNSPEGYCTLPPEDPDESARKIRDGIRALTGKDVAVVVADTELKLDKFGSVDVAVGCSGIQPATAGFEKKDLYGRPKFGGVDATADLMAAAAALLFGQTDEATHVVIIRGLKYQKSERGIKSALYPRQIWAKATKEMVLENIKFKLLYGLMRHFR